jgi:ribosomal protein L32
MTYDQWFKSQEGVAYEGMYLFAEAAWEAASAHMRDENTRLSELADKWNTECDELREDNKRLGAESAELKQTSLELCPKCGWSTYIPDGVCVHCEYYKMDAENQHLHDIIRNHVESSNNDDSAGDTFAALQDVLKERG